MAQAGLGSSLMATAMADLYPALEFTVQIPEATESRRGSISKPGYHQISHPRVSVQYRPHGTGQTVLNGAMYLLLFPATSPLLPRPDLCSRILAELQIHLPILASSQARLILVVRNIRQIPAEETCLTKEMNLELEARARLRDLSRWQLDNDRDMDMNELLQVVDQVWDSIGSLKLVDLKSSRDGSAVSLELQYQTFTERDPLGLPF